MCNALTTVDFIVYANYFRIKFEFQTSEKKYKKNTSNMYENGKMKKTNESERYKYI